uniref:Uncharacterized protein n=1 Tax=Rhipicephalus microplus TaxID=6941 RepID=A0A6G5AHX2_RHIMP
MCNSNFQAAAGPQSLQVYKPCPSRLLPIRLRKQVVTQTSLHLEGMILHFFRQQRACDLGIYYCQTFLFTESSQDLNAQIKKLEAIVEKLANQVEILLQMLPEQPHTLLTSNTHSARTLIHQL